MDLIGIENEAEFFPSGTLSDVLKDELQDITARWSGLPPDAHPVERLSRLSAKVVASLRQLRNTSDRERQAELARDLHHALVSALGYEWNRGVRITALEGHPQVPIAGRAVDASGRDALWIFDIPIPDVADEAADPLGSCFSESQFPADARDAALTDRPLEEILAEGVFGLTDGPRHVLVLGMSQIALVDKRKWPARSVLRFDLQEIFSRAERDTLTVMACLISREARVPEQGVPISDRLEEEAQRNANAVTTSLKKTVRDAIEILGQEVLDVTGGKYPGTFPDKSRRDVWIDGPELSLECLRYMYRLLFLFYAEANPRLNILDLRNPVYATGYSLEALRELESVPLRTPTDRQGTYLWESLQRTLDLLYKGENEVLRLPVVKVALLDPASTPLLNGLRLRNEAIQKVIRLLSLRSTGKSTGRISYAKLGIGQLGAVYETLISFTGVVAKTDLIELKPRKGRAAEADEGDGDDEKDEEDEDDAVTEEDGEDTSDDFRRDKVDTLAPSWFVPRSRVSEFKREEVVFNGAEARIYPKGTFIYRLAGRDREKSASYYTPEPLARLLVRHTLMERCKDLKADDILDLKILEPAMGSAAFLVETTNQLADIYLERKQKETGRTIPQDQVVFEKQKVRAFIADRNCFGVDLNPVAVELGAISLWLNGLHASEFSPWFGDQLHAGNSLIGSRRSSYEPKLLTAKKQADLWLTARPEEIGWRRRLPEGHVWQWLLPARDMANFEKDKSIAPFADKAQGRIKAWRKSDFFKALEPHEVKLLQRLSRIAEALFDKVAEDLARTRADANDEITLWPERVMPGNKRLDFRGKESLRARLTGADHAANTLPYKRVKTAMDAWCALWLWPLDKANLLPCRAEFLHGMAMILEGGFAADGSLAAPSLDDYANPSPDLFETIENPGLPRGIAEAASAARLALFRETNVEALIETSEWLKVAVEVAERERFVHFDLIFADVMRERGGFDVIVGNPPWAKPSWSAGHVLAEIDPKYAGLSATEIQEVLTDALGQAKDRSRYLREYVSSKGAMACTSSNAMLPFVGGGSNNLYRCFIDLSFRLVSKSGNVGLLHQDFHLNDAKAVEFRSHWYQRVVRHFHFRNELKRKMFSEVDNGTDFSLNVYRGERSQVRFLQSSFMFLPSQVEESFSHDGAGEVPAMKTDDNAWDTRGHRDKILIVDEIALASIRELSAEEGTDLYSAKFIQPYSLKILEVFKSISSFPKMRERFPRVVDGEELATTAKGAGSIQWQMSSHWNETSAQKGGVIEKSTKFRQAGAIILQGPQFHVANPLNKTPRAICNSNKAYDVVDLLRISEDYLPRTNFGPALPMAEYKSKLPRCNWDHTVGHADHYRAAYRKMLALDGERTLVGTIIPKGVSHIDSVQSVAFSDERVLLEVFTATISICIDFIIKSTGKQNFHEEEFSCLPWVAPCSTAISRALRLVSLTKPYAELWDRHAPLLRVLPWSSEDPRLSLEGPVEGSSVWNFSSGLRTAFARRMALVEIDVLIAQALRLTLEQLLEIYRIYFPTMKQYDGGTWYDQKGEIVWTANSNGLPGIGYLEEDRNGDMKRPSEAAWLKILASTPVELTCTAFDDTSPGGARNVVRRFVGPFTRSNRIEDYKRAWAHFERLKAGGAA